jgi:hypothetical protein
MLHCFAMLQSQRVNIFSLYISEREVFSPSSPFPPPPPVSHQHTFTAVSVFCINCPYTGKLCFTLKNRARSRSLLFCLMVRGEGIDLDLEVG